MLSPPLVGPVEVFIEKVRFNRLKVLWSIGLETVWNNFKGIVSQDEYFWIFKINLVFYIWLLVVFHNFFCLSVENSNINFQIALGKYLLILKILTKTLFGRLVRLPKSSHWLFKLVLKMPVILKIVSSIACTFWRIFFRGEIDRWQRTIAGTDILMRLSE